VAVGHLSDAHRFVGGVVNDDRPQTVKVAQSAVELFRPVVHRDHDGQLVRPDAVLQYWVGKVAVEQATCKQCRDRAVDHEVITADELGRGIRQAKGSQGGAANQNATRIEPLDVGSDAHPESGA
jgi:hypothetical protein